MKRNSPVFEEMQQLNNDIVKHAELYFVKDTPVIPDHIYDDMVKRFEQLSEDNPELAELFLVNKKPVPIHEPVNRGLELVQFDTPMLSLKKFLTADDVKRFIAGLPKDTAFFYECKLDGLALELVYVDGALVKMSTRGDGNVGEDVLHALPLFSNIPTQLVGDYPPRLVVRGEGIISFANFQLYNETALKQAVTPRNAVSGWVRALQENQNKAVIGLLQFHVYWSDFTLDAETYTELRDAWINLGLYPPPSASLEAIYANEDSNDWPIDGIVIKVDSLDSWVTLGATNKHPRWAGAYKFPFEESVTPFSDVEWNTTKTGRVVPTGVYEGIRIGNVMCRRALLDNYKQFMAWGLRSDTVVGVTRNGDVIPRVNRIIDAGVGPLFEAPKECPSCGSLLELRKSKQSADLVCNNVVGCPAQLLMRCVAMAHRRALDIDGLGPATLGDLIDREVIVRSADVLELTHKDVGDTIYQNILGAKAQPLYRVIKAFGLPGVDLIRAKKIATALPAETDIITFLKDTKALQRISGISAGIALPIAMALSNEDFLQNTQLILDWVTLVEVPVIESELKGCITGEIGQAREELIDYFGDHGIELVDKLTKDCQFLIVGEAPGKSKLLKATELGIDMVNATTATSVDTLIQTIKGIV